ncbi:MAG: glycosyltransferase family 1 protein [Patescibacteria group bacterium]|nr:glycosyltransferase family 1 protein [Patescibacteria group bacterium]
MKIAIDLRIFGTEPGGIGRYNQKLLEELIKIDSQNFYFLIFRKKPEIELPKNFQIILCDCTWYSFKEQLILPWLLYWRRLDLVHFTHFNVPVLYRKKFVVTVHDLIMTRFPSRRASTLNSWAFGLKYFFYRRVIAYAVKKAKKIIAVSQFGAADIKEYFQLSDKAVKKIKVVYEGVSSLTAAAPDSSSARLAWPEKYFLYVGNAYPHKNLEFLIKAFAVFRKNHPDYHLVLVGKKNYFYERLEKEANCPQVIFAGYLSDQELLAAYHQAQAYVFPSLFEGFGLPPLEAMSQSLPVLSSQASCLPEILGEAALYFDPKNQADLIQKMEEIISNGDLRDFLVQKGQEQIKKYSWEKMSKEILEIYQS